MEVEKNHVTELLDHNCDCGVNEFLEIAQQNDLFADRIGWCKNCGRLLHFDPISGVVTTYIPTLHVLSIRNLRKGVIIDE